MLLPHVTRQRGLLLAVPRLACVQLTSVRSFHVTLQHQNSSGDSSSSFLRDLAKQAAAAAAARKKQPPVVPSANDPEALRARIQQLTRTSVTTYDKQKSVTLGQTDVQALMGEKDGGWDHDEIEPIDKLLKSLQPYADDESDEDQDPFDHLDYPGGKRVTPVMYHADTYLDMKSADAEYEQLKTPPKRKQKKSDILIEEEIPIDHKNVYLLSQFVTDSGKIMHRRMTGLTAKSQRRISRAIRRARAAGLMPYMAKLPELSDWMDTYDPMDYATEGGDGESADIDEEFNRLLKMTGDDEFPSDEVEASSSSSDSSDDEEEPSKASERDETSSCDDASARGRRRLRA